MMKITLVFVLFVAIAITDGGEVCKDILKALIEARHEEYHRDFMSVKGKFTKQLKAIQDKLKTIQAGTGNGHGSYVRWGRTSCPKGAEFVYKGFIGGSPYNQAGGSSKPICLPDSPQFDVYQKGRNNQGAIYGTEYELGAFSKYKHLQNHDAPCVVCKTTRSAVLMIPARKRCTKGWRREYHGYLMSGHYGHHSSAEYICVDRNPETVNGGKHDHNGNLLYTVEATCGALPCPPYNNEKELTCVVCSA